MRSSWKYLSMVGTAVSLLACADVSQHVKPATAAAASTYATADQAYLIGRGHHLAQRFSSAIDAYEAALRMAPEHVNARNGLATLYAEQDQFDKAIPLWLAMTAVMTDHAGPESAFLFRNLGYAMFLKGDYDGALTALGKACVLDPLSHRTWQHLGSTYQKLGRHERAAAMYKQAAALEKHDFKADYAVARRTGSAAIDTAVAAADTQPSMDETRIEKTGNGMFVMRRIPARPADVAVVPNTIANETVSVSEAIAYAGPSLEIRNGNGVPGMARALAKTMASPNWRVVRLSNHKSFDVQRTRVEYQPEFRDAAELLAARFGAAEAVAVSSAGRVDMRLVIGHDLIKQSSAPVRISVDVGRLKNRG